MSDLRTDKPYTRADLPPLDLPDEEPTGPEEMEDGTEPAVSDEGAVVAESGEVAAETATETASTDSATTGEDLEETTASELAEAAERWNALQETYVRDPVSVMKAFLEQMTPQQKTAFIEQAQTATAPKAAPWGESQSEAETWLEERHQMIEAIPQIAQKTDEAFAMRDHYINDHDVRLATLEAQNEALAEFLQVVLPKLDPAALAKALDGKTNNRDAVSKVYKPTIKAALINTKQARKVRPDTPGNAASSEPNTKGLSSMNAIMRQITGRG